MDFLCAAGKVRIVYTKKIEYRFKARQIEVGAIREANRSVVRPGALLHGVGGNDVMIPVTA